MKAGFVFLMVVVVFVLYNDTSKILPPVVEDLLGVAGIQKRDAQVVEAEIALVGDGGTLAIMVVAGQHQRGAVVAGSGQIGVAKSVAAAVHARALAIPDAHHAVDVGFPGGPQDLGAEDGGGRQVFIQAGAKVNPVLFEELLGAGELKIVAAERRAFIAGDEPSGVEAGAAVAAHLVDRQPHQSLNSGEVDAAALDRVLVGEAHERLYRSISPRETPP